MIKKVQVLWYLNKDDLENYCIDFKEYKSHKLEGYEIVDVDEDLIYDLCDRDPDRLEPIGYFKNKKRLKTICLILLQTTSLIWRLDLLSLMRKPTWPAEALNFPAKIITFPLAMALDVKTIESPAGLTLSKRSITAHLKTIFGF